MTVTIDSRYSNFIMHEQELFHLVLATSDFKQGPISTEKSYLRFFGKKIYILEF